MSADNYVSIHRDGDQFVGFHRFASADDEGIDPLRDPECYEMFRVNSVEEAIREAQSIYTEYGFVFVDSKLPPDNIAAAVERDVSYEYDEEDDDLAESVPHYAHRGTNTSDPDSFERACDIVVEELVSILVSKQKDYGPSNILSFGEYGVLVRANDKIERLKNLLNSQRDPENESLEDTWRDLANYAIIALLLRRGWFDISL